MSSVRRIEIDVGGTFTDVVMVDDASGKVWSTKVPTTPRDRASGARWKATGASWRYRAGRSRSVSCFPAHGTTMATNMVVEGTGARTALITTRGFRDILEYRVDHAMTGQISMTSCSITRVRWWSDAGGSRSPSA